jgi:hypothetical protein
VKNQFRFSARYPLIILLGISLVSLSGCETLTRKFVRKSKAEKENVDEVIYSPQEYPAQIMSNNDMYRDYYTFWKGWHQELVDVLSEGQNHKKQVECINEIINNLNKMKDLLVPEAQEGLKRYIQRLSPIQQEIVAGRSNASNFSTMKAQLESIRTKINNEYSAKKAQNYIIH